MKVIFNCAYFSFHKQYCLNIKNYLENNGHIGIITESRDTSNLTANNIENYYILNHNDADFTILPDEACRVIGGKGIYINHCLIPVVPQNSFYYNKEYFEQIHNNASYLFLPSHKIKEIYINEFKLNKPIKIIGFPKFDKLFNIIKQRKTIKEKLLLKEKLNILYAPTGIHKKYVTSVNSINIDTLKEINHNIYCMYHPSTDKNNINLSDSLINADIVISDYSSVGYESILLNIPTILVDNKYWNNISYNYNLICETARNASIRVQNTIEVINAINIYLENPKYLEEERIKYSNLLSINKGNASKIFVDNLLNLL